MDTRLPYWGSVICGSVAVVLLVVNVSLANANRATQLDVQQRQAAIGSVQTFSQLSQFIAQGLAEAAKNGDTQARDLLASQGLRLKSDAAKTTAPSPAAKK